MAIMTGAAILGGIGVGGFLSSGRSARRREARARRGQEVLQRQQLRQQAQGQVRQMQMARAQGIQQAASSGTQDSSGLAGFLGGVGTTTAANIGFAQSTFNLQRDIGQIQRRAQRARGQQQMWGQAIQLGAQIGMSGFRAGATPAAGAGAASGAGAGTQAGFNMGGPPRVGPFGG